MGRAPRAPVGPVVVWHSQPFLGLSRVLSEASAEVKASAVTPASGCGGSEMCTTVTVARVSGQFWWRMTKW